VPAAGEPPRRKPGPRPAPTNWERHGGAASAPLRYHRLEPEKTLLHTVVREHLESFLAQARERSNHGRGLPAFVERELRAYTSCGLLARGFARVRCPDCGFERLVAFSGKASICPSCTTRRMEDGADHLVRNVLPAVPVRQWVLSFPRRMRFLAARHPPLASRLLDIFMRAVFAWQRKAARRLGATDPRTGGVTAVQRAGGAVADPDVTGGYYQPVRVVVAGDDTFELVRISCNLGSASAQVAADYQRRYHPNQNPELLPLEVSAGGGAPVTLDPEQPLEVDAGATAHLVAAWSAESAEAYVQYDLVSRQIVDRREALRVSWYVTAGALDLERSGRSEDDPGTTAANEYTAPAQPGSAHLWLVLRDSRGGVAYQHRPITIR
jgi:hypothetical protein